jgi:hypothetical protein
MKMLLALYRASMLESCHMAGNAHVEFAPCHCECHGTYPAFCSLIKRQATSNCDCD